MASFQEKVQNLINSFDEGVGMILLRLLLFVCFVALLFGLYAGRQFRGLNEPDAMEYAQLARNIAEGRGYVTQCIRPFDLWYLDKDNGGRPATGECPDLRHPPVYPMVLSLAMKLAKPSFEVKRKPPVFSPEKEAVVPTGIIFTVATVVMLFLLGRKLAGMRVGFVAALVYLLTDAVLASAISGLPIPLLSFFVTVAGWVVVSCVRSQAAGKGNVGWLVMVVLAAVFCVLAFLTDYKMFVLAPIVVAFLLSQLHRCRWAAAILLLAVVVIGVSPWLLHNRSRGVGLFGAAPYAVARNTSLYAENSLERLPDPDVDNLRLFRSVKSGFAAKISNLLSPGLPTAGGGIIVCFFVASLFHRFERAGLNEFRWSVLLGLVLLFPAVALSGGMTNRIFLAFFPLIALVGTATFVDYLDREEFFEAGWQTILTWALVVLTALPTVFTLAGRASPVYPPYYPPLTAFACGLLNADETICTDIPWATAWYGNRRSLLLPSTIDDFSKINTEENNIKGLYLTTQTGNRPYTKDLRSGKWQSWLPVLSGQAPEDFPLRHAIWLPGGTYDQLFLTDRPRWTRGGK